MRWPLGIAASLLVIVVVNLAYIVVALDVAAADPIVPSYTQGAR